MPLTLKGILSRRRDELVLLISLSPILALLLIDEQSFILGWNEGRGGLLFTILFLLIEWYDSREELKLRQLSKRRMLLWFTALAGLSLYYGAVYLLHLQEAISNLGKGLGISKEGLLSWTWLWEYVAFAAYIAACVAALHGRSAVKKTVTPIIYCVGSSIILLLDALFPYESLGALAGVVPFIVKAVVSLLWVSGVSVVEDPLKAVEPPWVYVERNRLFLNGLKGMVVLEINWPCAGVLSMLIYSLVVVILMVKLEAPRKRKLIYVVVGAAGTFMVNVIRIFLITLAVVYSNIDLRVFHETVGEVLFVVWIVIYLVSTLTVEKAFASRALKALRPAEAALN
ncbi:MAG: archaeosortase/exosortase family protein [Candidatus Bathyarchaeia archaeon]